MFRSIVSAVSLAVTAVLALAVPVSVHAQGQPVTWKYDWHNNVARATYPGEVVIAGQPVSPNAPTAADMANLPSSTGTVIRLGYAALGDAPPQLYKATNAPCTLNAGAGDGGWQVPTSDGKCWVAVAGDSMDIRQWGLQAGGQADVALKAAIVMACATHTPITIPYNGSVPYLLGSSIVVGDGNASRYSNCNGITIKGDQFYNASTSGTTPPGYLMFLWNGPTNQIPFVVEGPITSIEMNNLSVNCNNICVTGAKFDATVESRFSNWAVELSTGPAVIVTAKANTTFSGNEGSTYSNFSLTLPGVNGSGAQIGSIDCNPCSAATISNIFSNWTVNYDSRNALAYGIKLGAVSQSTFINLRTACLFLYCNTAVPQPHGVVISPPPGNTAFPTDVNFIHPIFQGIADDPGGAWTGTNGITFSDYSTVYSSFPTAVNFNMFKGTDDAGIQYPTSRTWTPADTSGAGLSVTVNSARWTRSGNTCSGNLDVTYPVTANVAVAQLGTLPTFCRPLTSAPAAVGYTDVGSAIGALVDVIGVVSINNTSGGATNNAALSGKRMNISFSFPIK